MYQCILNVPLRNDWSKVTYSQVHGSPALKTYSKVSAGFLWQHLQSSYSLGEIRNLGGPEFFVRNIYCFIEERFCIPSFIYL